MPIEKPRSYFCQLHCIFDIIFEYRFNYRYCFSFCSCIHSKLVNTAYGDNYLTLQYNMRITYKINCINDDFQRLNVFMRRDRLQIKVPSCTVVITLRLKKRSKP